MPIVLAIEPDRRQAAHLKAIVGHQVGAELLLADTTEGALDAIGNRVPDLVLVPALLSPQDDAALAAALRVIAAAAHVRTLTIPVLASGTKHAAPGGMLAKWRRNRSASPEPDGCDPAVFGEQISAYLREVAAQRAEQDEEPAPILTAAPIAFEQPTAIEPAVVIEQAHAPATPPAAEEAETPGEDPDQEPLFDLSDELAELGDDAADERYDETVGVYTISTEADEPAIDAFDLIPALLDPASSAPVAVAPVDVVSVVAAPVQAEIEESFVEPLVEPFVESFVAPFVEQPEQPRPDIEPWVPMSLAPGRMWPTLEGMPAETPAARTEQPDWIELVASLRHDLERRRIDARVVAVDPLAARPSDDADAEGRDAVRKPTPRARKAKPIQDEWGFFDPERCGFSTLLAKLEEITHEGAGG